MKFTKCLIFIIVVTLAIGNIGIVKVICEGERQEIICDNGLSGWLNSNSKFGQWIAKSVRKGLESNPLRLIIFFALLVAKNILK